MQDLLNVLKEISSSITTNHTDLIMDKAMDIEAIETTYYHGEIDDLETDPLDFINLYVIKEIAEYVSPVIGGAGCVRDVIEQTLRVQGKWADKDELGW